MKQLHELDDNTLAMVDQIVELVLSELGVQWINLRDNTPRLGKPQLACAMITKLCLLDSMLSSVQVSQLLRYGDPSSVHHPLKMLKEGKLDNAAMDAGFKSADQCEQYLIEIFRSERRRCDAA